MHDSVAAVLFDLDGTLLNTAPDLGHALNQVCRHYQRDCVPEHIYTPVASHGSRGLLKLAFADMLEEHGDTLRQHFLSEYEANIARHSHLFDGMAETLSALEAADVKVAIVTNKPEQLTRLLLPSFPQLNRIAVVVGGDTLAVAKPSPEPLWHAAQQLNVEPKQCLYVGDAERDIEAGRRAGMTTVLANYGYIDDSEQPQCWGADYQIDQPLELLSILSIAEVAE